MVRKRRRGISNSSKDKNKDEGTQEREEEELQEEKDGNNLKRASKSNDGDEDEGRKKCRLCYFNAASCGEPIRWILKYAHVPFIDERISYEDWPAQKSRKVYL